jgi:hypothetical protein
MADARKKMDEILKKRQADEAKPKPDNPLKRETPYSETNVGKPNPLHSESYVKGTTPYQGKADGGIVDKLEEMYDLRETYPTQFDNAVNSFKGEMGKICDIWN